MLDLSENSKLKWLLIGNFFFVTGLIFDTNEEIRTQMELVAYPTDEFKKNVISILFKDLAFCYCVEKVCKTIYIKSFEKKEDEDE